MLDQSPAFQSVQHLCQQWMWKCVLPDLMLYRVGLVLSWRKGQGAEGIGICVLVCEEGVCFVWGKIQLSPQVMAVCPCRSLVMSEERLEVSALLGIEELRKLRSGDGEEGREV